MGKTLHSALTRQWEATEQDVGKLGTPPLVARPAPHSLPLLHNNTLLLLFLLYSHVCIVYTNGILYMLLFFKKNRN